LSFLYNDCVRIGRRGNTDADSYGNRDTDADSYANFNSAAHSHVQRHANAETSPHTASSAVRK
jgi:hypothetical protein